MSESNRIFISYARTDAKIAQALADELDAIGISYWIDYANLAIGEDWTKTIAAALHNADGIVILSSAQSSMSDWVAREIRFAVKSNVPLLPVVVDDFAHLPRDLTHIQAILIRTDRFDETVRDAAYAIRDWLTSKPDTIIDEAFSKVFAEDLAEEVNKAGQTTTDDAKHSVFVVHGHDSDALDMVREYLVEIGVRPIILKDNEEPDDSLLRRFLRVAEQATFAVVVMSPDDFGASLSAFQAPKGGENALRYRARQNVILELGFFLGKLKDFNKVFVLRKPPPEAWPEFEPPSDLAGAIFKEIDAEGRWKHLLRTALSKNGVEVT